MAIGKEINGYQNDHALKVKAYMDNDQNENECVSWQQTTMCYHEMGLVQNNEHKICHMHQ